MSGFAVLYPTYSSASVRGKKIVVKKWRPPMIDLHTHSLFSDGQLVPAEHLRRAGGFTMVIAVSVW
jgi:hypothetical protein